MPNDQVWLRLPIAVLAVWRLAHLVSSEDGPFDAITRIRLKAGDGSLGKLLDCPFCLSLWFAAPLAAFVTRDPLEWAVVWLAVSGGSCLLERGVRQRETQEHSGGTSDVVLWTVPPGGARAVDVAGGERAGAGASEPVFRGVDGDAARATPRVAGT
jgi:hypothetical protein